MLFLVSTTAALPVFAEEVPSVSDSSSAAAPTLSLNQTDLSGVVGSSVQLTATLSPEDPQVPILWTSSNPSVVSVTADGLVTILADSPTPITITAAAGTLTASCTVTPKLIDLQVPETMTLAEGQRTSLPVTVQPENTAVSYHSSDDSIVDIDDQGALYALREGTADIVVTAGTEIAVCTVTVVPIPVSGIKLSRTTATMEQGASITLKAHITPENASDQSVSWKSSKPSVATVSASGKVTGKKVGTTTITAKSKNGKTARCTVTVRLKAPTVQTTPETRMAIRLQWNKSKGAVSYRIYRGDKKTGSYTRIKTVQGEKTTSYIDKTCSMGKGYYYKVKAIGTKEAYNSSASKAVKGKTYPYLHVPYLSQTFWPTGCEAASATMVLQYYKVNATIAKTVRNLPKGSLYYQNGRLYGPHPDMAFIGNPSSYSGYGCYSNTIAATMNKMLPKNKQAVSLKGKSLSTLEHYLDNGQPVLLWATMNMVPSYKTAGWYVSGTGQYYRWIAEEHCLVLTGYDKDNYYFNDPYNSHGRVFWNKSLVAERYRELGKQAVVVIDA